ncbi:hypothetical protein [Streptomyces sp. NPDC050560]|uniref:hypothetical protein n=1 Tax=Streptomyces sp. NPDC050560 TaxID=3365630 RepID=UPI00379FBA83
MTTRFDGDDEDARFAPDDPLAVILRPSHGLLEPPPGRFEEVHRAAGRRKLLRTAGGLGLACAAALTLVLALQPGSPERPPTTPTVPLAPPATGGGAPDPTPTTSPSAGTPSDRPPRSEKRSQTPSGRPRLDPSRRTSGGSSRAPGEFDPPAARDAAPTAGRGSASRSRGAPSDATTPVEPSPPPTGPAGG